MSLDFGDFNNLMGHVDNFVNQISDVQSRMINTQHREMFENLISKIREARQEAEVAVPAAIKGLQEKRERVVAKLKKLNDEAPQRKARRDALVAKAKEVNAKREEEKKKLRAKPVKAKLSKVKMPPGWGDHLKDELLNKFGKLPAAPLSAPRDAAIWDDWQWNGDKPIGEG